MPRIQPFRPLRYNPEIVNDPGAVIAPPYDVITPAAREALIERDEHNVIRLILPAGDADARYAEAARLLHEWIAAGVLVRESVAALYPYAQTFLHPTTGAAIVRHGFVTAMDLTPFSAGEVLPHERTLSGPKADRLQLMRATEADVEAIFGVYRDPTGTSRARLGAACEAAAPIVDVTDADGVRHRLWRVTDPEMIAAFVADLAAERVFIVDGHHRYETALSYHAERRAASGGQGTDGAGDDRIMIFLAPTTDPGLVILPTHRAVHGLAAFDIDALERQLSEHFDITSFDDAAEATAALREHAGRPAYAIVTPARLLVAVLREAAAPGQLVGADLPAAVRDLDVTILHEYIFQRLLGISAEAQAEQRNLVYLKSDADAIAAAVRGDAQLVVLMNPTRLDQVERVAESGHVMPQKSTYVYPKLASGLMFRPFGS